MATSKNYAAVITLSILLLVGSALTLGCSPTTTAAVESDAPEEAELPYEGKKVLVVDSYHVGDEATDEVQAAIMSALAGSGVEIDYMYMDTKRNREEEFAAQAAQEVLERIEAFDPDVLIAAQDNVQESLVVPYLIGGDLPVIFNGVNWDASVYGFPADNVTGVVEVDLIGQVVSHLEAYADGESIGYLAVTSNTEVKTTDIYQERFFDGNLQVNLVETYDEYKETFLSLQDEVDMLLLGNHAGIDEWSDEEMQAFFEQNTEIPTGGVRARTAPFALITIAKLNAEQGELAAEMLFQVFDDTAVSDIPLTENKRGALYLNLAVAEQLDITFPPSLLRAAEVFGTE